MALSGAVIRAIEHRIIDGNAGFRSVSQEAGVGWSATYFIRQLLENKFNKPHISL